MRGKGNIILIVVVSVILIAGMSFAAKRMGLGIYGNSTNGSYKDNVLRASGGDPNAPYGYGGCSSGGCTASGGPGAPSGGCGTSGGCGSGSGGLSVEQVKAGALKFYAQKYGDAEVICEVKDFGCHMEAQILDKDGQLLKKFSISGGRITEIG